ncbi:hypothetical protein J2X65_001315 [Ancylobacter sp. 3268]|nr:hypothetical protein [Ancylobacter sp. 3268]
MAGANRSGYPRLTRRGKAPLCIDFEVTTAVLIRDAAGS